MILSIISITISIIFILFSFYFFKWAFRILALLVVAKGLSQLKGKAEDKLKEWKDGTGANV
jgi:hypothetical protein